MINYLACAWKIIVTTFKRVKLYQKSLCNVMSQTVLFFMTNNAKNPIKEFIAIVILFILQLSLQVNVGQNSCH